MRNTLAAFVRSIGNRLDPSFAMQHHPYLKKVKLQKDFLTRYEEGIARSDTPPSVWRRDRFYNLYSLVQLVKDLEGDIAECGTWRGLSSYLLCTRIRDWDPGFKGENYHIFDSFEGLSMPTSDDRLPSTMKGHFPSDLKRVKEFLSEFPHITYHKGWIPETFAALPERSYCFVHIDLDLVEPTIAAFEFFYPRMVKGGVIVCDDYASTTWPGTKDAIDSFCKRRNVRAFSLQTCQLIVLS